MARDLDPFKLSSPRIFLVRMMVFLILCGLVVVVLHKQIVVAFMANPGLNALIIGVLFIGILLSFRQVIRLFAEVAWVNGFRLADPGLAVARPPVLLAPMATILGERAGRMAISPTTMRGLMDSIATRLDEARDISRYMTSLLVFLGLLGTFWGLIETVGSVGGVIQNLKVGGEAGAVFDSLREGLAAPLERHGHLVLVLAVRSCRLARARLPRPAGRPGAEPLLHGAGGLALHHGERPDRRQRHAPRRMAAPSGEMRSAIEKLKEAVADTGSNRAATAAMANLAEAIHGLVSHMRTEQQMIRDWADAQAAQGREMNRLLERIAGEEPRKDELRKTDESLR